MIVSPATPAQLADRLDLLVTPALGTLFPTCVIRVEQWGEVLYEGAWGRLDGGHDAAAATGTTIFDLASLTKIFVASAFLRLASEHGIPLNQTVSTLVPAFSDDVTFWHLLTHSSGLPAHVHLYRTATTRDDVIRQIVRLPLEAVPGQRVTYSCLGFILLGEAMRRLTGYDLDVLVPRMVLQPLGIAPTDALYCPPAALLPRIAPTELCTWRGRRLRGEVHDENAAALGGVSGNAGLFGTAAAVCRLGAAFLPGAAASFGLPDVPRQAAITCQITGAEGERRGLGWQLRGLRASSAGLVFSPATFGHTGFTGTCLWVDPACGVSVAILTNRVYYGRETTDLLGFRSAVNEAVACLVTA